MQSEQDLSRLEAIARRLLEGARAYRTGEHSEQRDIQELDDKSQSLVEDYRRLQAECERLRKLFERCDCCFGGVALRDEAIEPTKETTT